MLTMMIIMTTYGFGPMFIATKHTILESKKLKNRMHKGDNHCDAQKNRIGFHNGSLQRKNKLEQTCIYVQYVKT